MEELAQHLNLSANEVGERERLRVLILSMDDAFHADPDTGELHPNEHTIVTSNPEKDLLARFTQAESVRLADDVNACLEKILDDMERSILVHRVLDKLSVRDLGQLLKTSKDTVSRREKEAKKKMKTKVDP